MLENAYWIAGIVGAVAAVIGIFLKIKSSGSVENNQNANVSGENNTVNQSSNVNSEKQK